MRWVARAAVFTNTERPTPEYVGALVNSGGAVLPSRCEHKPTGGNDKKARDDSEDRSKKGNDQFGALFAQRVMTPFAVLAAGFSIAVLGICLQVFSDRSPNAWCRWLGLILGSLLIMAGPLCVLAGMVAWALWLI